MTIMIFGVSNVGKTTVGKILADKLSYRFYDMDEEVKNRWEYHSLEDFVHTGTLEERDEFRGKVLQELMEDTADKVITITPISYPEYVIESIKRPDVLRIELIDTVENIFSRLVFSDENDVVYKDDEYRYHHKDYYMREIVEDQKWYGSVNEQFDVKKMNMDGTDAETVAEKIVEKFKLKKIIP